MKYLFLILGGIWAISWLEAKSRSSKRKQDFTMFANNSNSESKPIIVGPNVSKMNVKSTIRKTIVARKIIPIDDIELTDEFKQTFALMENSKDCLYITGKAGTGKSTLLRYFREKTNKKIAVLSPTGIAAITVNGQTIHSFFQFPPRFIQPSEVKLLGKTRQLVQKVDTIIIDEASMVRADIMDGIDYSLKINRSNDAPFGGAQIILMGDLFQLPPVVRADMKEFFDKKYSSPYFFSASVFEKVAIRCIELTHIFRQKDPQFIALLNNIREGSHTEGDLKFLNSRVVGETTEKSTYITLTPKNDDAARINAEHLAKINEPPQTFTAIIADDFKESEYPNEFHLVLKKNAQVMMIRNDTEQKRWVNGSLGHVEKLTTTSIRVNINGNVHEVLREKWEKIQYKYNPETESVEPEVIGTFEQFPVRLAWAITIHKSQGQTFDDVDIDIGDGAFAHGQVYVALSRCTSLEGIRLKRNISRRDVIFDHRVREFNLKDQSG